jgi:hypothetical protein
VKGRRTVAAVLALRAAQAAFQRIADDRSLRASARMSALAQVEEIERVLTVKHPVNCVCRTCIHRPDLALETSAEEQARIAKCQALTA